MEIETFYTTLQEELTLPFSIEEVTAIESNGGTIWIDCKDGSSYWITIASCEPDND